MLNRRWLPEGEHLRITSSSSLPSTSKGSNHAYSAKKNRSSFTNELGQLFTEIAPLMLLYLVYDVLRHCVLSGHWDCSRA